MIMVLSCRGVWGQSDNPFIRNYPRNAYFSNDFVTAPQNWGFAQDTSGRMYLANTHGVLEFDGKSWRMITGTEGLTSLRIHTRQNGQVLVGSRTDFGYLSPDADGQLAFVSLRPLMQDSFSKAPAIRSIWEANDGMYFVSTNHIWRWNPEQQSLIHQETPSSIQNAFLHGGRLYCRVEGKGICTISDDGWDVFSSIDQEVPGKVQLILSLSPSENEPQNLLLICQREGIYQLLDGQLRLWSEKIEPILPDLQIWDAIKVLPDKIAFATHNQGLILTDFEGNVVQTYDREAGLISNSLITVFQDRQSGIWVSSDIGISRVDYPPGLQFFGYNSLLEGAVISVVRQGKTLWAGTTNGLFNTTISSRDSYLFFQKESISLDEVWALAGVNGDLLIGATRGLFIRNPSSRFLNIFDKRVNTLLVSGVFPNIVYAGLEDGVGVLENKAGKWVWKGMLEGIGHAVRTLAEEPDGTLWAAYREVSQIAFPQGITLLPKVEKMGNEEGFTDDLDIIEPSYVGGRIRFGTYNGLRIFDKNQQKLLPDTTLPARFYDGTEATYFLKTDASGRFWLSLGSENGWFEHLNTDHPAWQSNALNPVSSEVVSIYPDPAGIIWVGTLEGLYRFIPEASQASPANFLALIRKVEGTRGSPLFWGAGNPTSYLKQIKYPNNTIRFECSSSSQKFPEQVKFRFWLDGYEKNWSEWAYSSTKEYTRLWEGNYRFHVQAKDVYGNESVVAAYQFRVLAPWYRTWWAWLIYVILFAMAVVVGARVILRKQRQKLQDKEAELKLERETAERLRQVDRLKDEFLANTSHELRTPLNGIIGITESLFEQSDNLRVRQNLGMVIASGKRLSSLVNDLLDFSRIRNADLVLRQRPIDLRSVVDVVLQVSLPMARGKNLQLENLVPAELPAAFADEDRLTQILYNLIGNAIKFTENGYIHVTASVKDEKLEIAIADTGIGIAKDKWESIFDAFEQGDGSISRTYAGTGLGLSISKTLVERHGGRMWVESEVGKGSTFYFTLTISDEKAEALTEIENMRLTPIRVNPADTGIRDMEHDEILVNTNIERTRILIVDDEPINHQVLKNYLREERYEIVSAMNGTEAMSILETDASFDIVLLDVMMPRMSGYEVCRLIRQKHLPSELPIIMITAKNQVNDLVQGLNIGANDYLAKPFSKDEFLARLSTHLNLGQINRATNRFVPNEFIKTLGHNSITEVRLGDNIAREVTVLFSDIRDYTTLSESLTPDDNFRFVNAYARRMGPVIHNHHGFVNQYLGDGIMALFQQSPGDAIAAAVGMQAEIRAYNTYRLAKGRKALKVGMGLHTGPLIMGIIGDNLRSEAAIIADTVNIASRLEGLTKYYHTHVLLSEMSYLELSEADQATCRYLGKVQVKGKQEAIGIYECLAGEEEKIRDLKLSTKNVFDQGLQAYLNKEFIPAAESMKIVLAKYPEDETARYFLTRVTQLIQTGVPEEWTGIEEMKGK
ncbi:MAG: response regulator [Bacteroidia bacterium]